MPRPALYALAAIALAALIYFVWPTPYAYSGTAQLPIRRNRITGEMQVWRWQLHRWER